ncbi:hypothetical protein ACIBJI_08520 [Nocardia sp. NPDC050408]|uniref:hypothetical protein n=1 Tax=unclassified Nocardia TaxID=2637762 RepID=UPI00343F0D15
MGGGNTASAIPQGIIADIVGGGVCERFPNLHFNLVEYSAGWLVSYLGVMDRSWRTGTGQVPDEDRAAILGGTLADIVGFDNSKKLAEVPEGV